MISSPDINSEYLSFLPICPIRYDGNSALFFDSPSNFLTVVLETFTSSIKSVLLAIVKYAKIHISLSFSNLSVSIIK